MATYSTYGNTNSARVDHLVVNLNTFLHSAEDLDTLTQTLNPSHKAHLGMQKRYVDIDPIITYVEPDTKCHSIEEQ